jgi:hypothetical protein
MTPKKSYEGLCVKKILQGSKEQIKQPSPEQPGPFLYTMGQDGQHTFLEKGRTKLQQLIIFLL